MYLCKKMSSSFSPCYFYFLNNIGSVSYFEPRVNFEHFLFFVFGQHNLYIKFYLIMYLIFCSAYGHFRVALCIPFLFDVFSSLAVKLQMATIQIV